MTAAVEPLGDRKYLSKPDTFEPACEGIPIASARLLYLPSFHRKIARPQSMRGLTLR